RNARQVARECVADMEVIGQQRLRRRGGIGRSILREAALIVLTQADREVQGVGEMYRRFAEYRIAVLLGSRKRVVGAVDSALVHLLTALPAGGNRHVAGG